MDENRGRMENLRHDEDRREGPDTTETTPRGPGTAARGAPITQNEGSDPYERENRVAGAPGGNEPGPDGPARLATEAASGRCKPAPAILAT